MDLSKQHTRDARYELLRIFAMFSIVLYHIWLFYLPDLRCPEHPIVCSLFPLMHVGVPVFFLISGYFGIKATWKGLITFVSIVALYYLPPAIYHGIRHDVNVQDLLFLSNTSCYWFVRAYLYLYLLAPGINYVLNSFDRRKTIILIFILAIISLYFGFYNVDGNLDDRSIFNVILLYSIGWFIHYHWHPAKKQLLFLTILFVLINVISSITRYFVLADEFLYSLHNRLFFDYNSLGCIFNAIVVFLLFGMLQLKNGFGTIVNYISSSMFAVYIISGQPLIVNFCNSAVLANSTLLSTGGVFAAFVVFATCVVVDKLMTPIWFLRDKMIMKYKLNKMLY